MTHTAYLPVGADVRSRFAASDRAERIAFVEAAWPLTEDTPDAPRWATASLAARRETAVG
jgi:hypothetical protein